MAAKVDESGLGKAIRRRRLEAGLTLKELATRVGVHFTTVSAWERGRSMPGFDIMPRLAASLGTRPADLFGGIWEITLAAAPEPIRLPPIATRSWDDFRRSVESLRFSLAADRAREARALSPDELAGRTGLGVARVRELLSGRAEPGLSEALAVSAAIGLDVLPPDREGDTVEGGPVSGTRKETAWNMERLRHSLKALPEVPRQRLVVLWGRLLDWIDPPREKE